MKTHPFLPCLRTALAAVLLAALSLPALLGRALAAPFSNPIVEASPRTGSADPSVVFYRGHYYYCRSIGDGGIGVARARRLQDIGAAQMTTVFRPPAASPYSRQIWAPELQRVRGRWYIYFAASDGVNANHRMYALQALTDDPRGAYEFKGRVADPSDVWAIDGAVLDLGKALYFVWSGWPQATSGFPQVLYIAAMRNPWTIVGERHPIAAPQHAWEQAVAPLLEAPQPLRRRGRTHIFYSAGASWSDEYALGLLTYAGGDPLRADAWIRRPLPVFAKNVAAGVFGPGHASFVRSPDRREDWIVYHATARAGAGWAARSVRAQRFGWCRDGSPAFGSALAVDQPVEEPSGTPGPGRSASSRATSWNTCRAAWPPDRVNGTNPRDGRLPVFRGRAGRSTTRRTTLGRGSLRPITALNPWYRSADIRLADVTPYAASSTGVRRCRSM